MTLDVVANEMKRIGRRREKSRQDVRWMFRKPHVLHLSLWYDAGEWRIDLKTRVKISEVDELTVKNVFGVTRGALRHPAHGQGADIDGYYRIAWTWNDMKIAQGGESCDI